MSPRESSESPPLTTVEARIWATWRELRRGPALRRLAVLNYTDDDGATLDVTQVDTLEAIAAVDGIPMGDLAAQLGVDSSTATRAVDKLERRDLVTRTRRSDNGRYIVVSATEVGKASCATFVANRRKAMHRILSRFSKAEQETLAELLGRMAVGLNRVASPTNGSKAK